MLTRLLVRNFLLVSEAKLDFCAGLNVLTGETGTGKSVLLEALGLVLGKRGGQSLVGPAGDELLVEAAFKIDRRVAKQLSEIGIVVEGQEAFLSRRLRSKGEGHCFINGQRVLLRQLKKIGSQLVEIHGQREEERFRLPENQRDLLDLFGNQTKSRKELRLLFSKLSAKNKELSDFQTSQQELSRDEDWIRFQLKEIDDLGLQPGEFEEHRESVRASRSDRDVAEWLALAEQLLNRPEGGILEMVETLSARSNLLPETETWTEVHDQINQLRQITLRLYRNLRDHHQQVGDDLAKLPELEERLSVLETVQRKHQKSIAEIIELASEMRRSLNELELGAEEERRICLSLEAAESEFIARARALSKSRQSAARAFSKAIQKEMLILGMKNFRLKVEFPPHIKTGDNNLHFRSEIDLPGDSSNVVANPTGLERVRFIAQTNPGNEYRPLGDIASGGEMARIALAFRVVLGKKGRSILTVFDEIDTGLGATAAKTVAARLSEVADHRQVLLVTHLPVIAAVAQRHFLVGKNHSGKRNLSSVKVLDDSERIGEIARMLGGDASDSQARQHAKSLLSLSSTC